MTDRIDFHGVQLQDEVFDVGVLGTYEQEEMDLADRTFVPGDRVVVAGCGMGWTAVWIARRVGVGNVVGIEPQAHLVDLVRQNVAYNGMPLTVRHGALTRDGAAATYTTNPDNWALTRAAEWGRVPPAQPAPGVDLVPMQRAGWDCLALDIEGGEVDVLTDLVLSRTRKLLLDLHRFAVDTRGLEKRLVDSGMELVGEYDRMDRATGKENATHQAWVRL